MVKLRIIILATGFFLTACGEEQEPQSAEDRAAAIQAAQTRLPSDPALAEKYQRSCKACHADPENAAPLAGDPYAWQPRIKARGLDGLLNSSLNGFGGMPPLGACLDCGVDDFKNLIAFMAGETQ